MLFEYHVASVFVECPSGTYKPDKIPGDVLTCTKCPDENHITVPGATSIQQCVCRKGYRNIENKGCAGNPVFKFTFWIQIDKVIYCIVSVEVSSGRMTSLHVYLSCGSPDCYCGQKVQFPTRALGSLKSAFCDSVSEIFIPLLQWTRS